MSCSIPVADTETTRTTLICRSRKLLEIDFFARVKMPAAGQKWNLAALATMLLFVNQRFTIKKSSASEPVYGRCTVVLLHLACTHSHVTGTQ